MFATIVGGALALVFIGLPLAIIGLFIQSLLERRNRRPAAGDVESRPIDSEHLLGRAGTASEAPPSHRPNTLAAGHLPGLATPNAARHHDTRTPHSARDHSRAERRGPNSRSAFDGQCASVSGRSRNAGKRARSPRVTWLRSGVLR